MGIYDDEVAEATERKPRTQRERQEVARITAIVPTDEDLTAWAGKADLSADSKAPEMGLVIGVNGTGQVIGAKLHKVRTYSADGLKTGAYWQTCAADLGDSPRSRLVTPGTGESGIGVKSGVILPTPSSGNADATVIGTAFLLVHGQDDKGDAVIESIPLPLEVSKGRGGSMASRTERDYLVNIGGKTFTAYVSISFRATGNVNVNASLKPGGTMQLTDAAIVADAARAAGVDEAEALAATLGTSVIA